MTMRYSLAAALGAAALLDVPSLGAQRAQCRGCDTARAVVAPAGDRVLAEQLARLSAEVERLRAELARTQSTDSSSARALRTTISSLLMSQRHLEQAMRDHEVVIRSREVQQAPRATVVQGGRAFSGAVPGYVGLTTEARYTIDERDGGRVRRTAEFPVIVTVAPGSPAHRAGLAAGDTVIAVGNLDGRLLEQRLGSMLRPGQTLEFRVRRGSDERVHEVLVEARAGSFTMFRREEPVSTVRIETQGEGDARRATVAVGARSAPAIGATVVPLGPDQDRVAGMAYVVREPAALAGVRLAPLSHDLAAKLGVEQGLLVLTVGPDTPGSRAGLEAGDAIIGTASGQLTSLTQLYALMSSSKTGSVTLRVVRDREPRMMTLRW